LTINKIIAAAGLSSAMLFSGCATVVTGTDQPLTFKTEPEGAKVSVSGRILGVTPITAVVDKGENQVLTFEKDGYKPFTTQLSTTTEPWMFGNVIFGLSGMFSSTTDNASNAMHQFSPDQYFIHLVPNTKAALTTNVKPKIKAYIMHNSEQLTQEINAGEGEILSGLLELLGSTLSPENVTVVQGLKANAANDLEFANALIEFFEIN